jgi:tetratricopeptide (TPR) repeat protein
MPWFRRNQGRNPDCEDLNDEGNAYQGAHRLSEARSSYEQAIMLAQNSGDQKCEMKVQGNFGACCWTEQKYQEARHYESALSLARALGDRRSEAMYLERLASANLVLQNVNDALEYYDLALKIAEELQDTNQKSRILHQQALLYGMMGPRL